MSTNYVVRDKYLEQFSQMPFNMPFEIVNKVYVKPWILTYNNNERNTMNADKIFNDRVKKEMGYTDGVQCCNNCSHGKDEHSQIDKYECSINTFTVPVKKSGKCKHHKAKIGLDSTQTC